MSALGVMVLWEKRSRGPGISIGFLSVFLGLLFSLCSAMSRYPLPAEMAEARFASLASLGNSKFAPLVYAETAALRYKRGGGVVPASDHQYIYS